jgi:hypothetical protein
MTDAERLLWATAQQDYDHAFKIAQKAWISQPDDAVIQAATATILIHVTKLRESSHRTAAPSSAAPAAVKRDETRGPSQASGAVPPCPKCSGKMWDNRASKKKETQPDFVCRDKNCKDGKFTTALWEKDLPKPNGAKGQSQPRPTEGYDQVPAGLAEDRDDDLPF